MPGADVDLRRERSNNSAQVASLARLGPRRIIRVEPTDESAHATRVCSNCGAQSTRSERFCTHCGRELPQDAVTEVAIPPRPAPSPWEVIPAGAAAPTGRTRRRESVFVLAGLLVVALGAAALMAALWQQERSSRHRDDRTNAQKIAGLDARVSSLQSRLTRAQALSSQQEVVLRNTTAVLGKVDPLLSKADDLQQLTSGIQTDRDAFSNSTSQLVNDMITLGNELIDAANSYGVDISYLQSEIDVVNGDINSVRSQASSLTTSDGRYSSASQAFGRTATQFTNAVRGLQRELKKLPPPPR
jgi:zinc-ribbon domain